MMLLDHYSRFLKESNPKKKKLAYDIFRQGLDLLDLDNLTYAMIDIVSSVQIGLLVI